MTSKPRIAPVSVPALPMLRILRRFADAQGLPFTRWREVQKVRARYTHFEAFKN